MKLYLIDPKLNWYKANLHCHTCKSDGFYTPEDIKRIYMAEGYQVVAFTDHEIIFDNRNLTDENFVAITSAELSITDVGKPANKTYTNEEMVSWRDTKNIHLNIYAKDPNNLTIPACNKEMFNERHYEKYGSKNIPCDGYKREFTKESIQETIDRCNKAGFLVQLNHPNWSLLREDDFMYMQGLWGFEVLNYLTELETGAEYCINLFDILTREGHNLIPTMGDDNHNYNGTYEGSFGGFNYIGCKELTYKNVVESMEKGIMYSSSGPIIKSMYIDTKTRKIFVSCSSATDIILVGYNRIFRHYHGSNLKKADFQILDNEIYFRITVKDKYGKVAHTKVYNFKELGL